MVVSICLLNNKTVNKNSLKEKGTIYALYLDGMPIKQFPDKNDYKVIVNKIFKNTSFLLDYKYMFVIYYFCMKIIFLCQNMK